MQQTIKLEAEQTVIHLLQQARKSVSSLEAMQYTQAAQNTLHVLVMAIPLEEPLEESR